MKIVFAAHTPRHGTFVVGSHHLSREFAKMGHQVLHLSPPITPLHLMKWSDTTTKLRFKCTTRFPVQDTRENKNIYDWIPFSVLPLKVSLLRDVKHNLSLRSIMGFRGALVNSGFSEADILIIDHPGFWGIWEFIDSKKLIYRPTDIYMESYPNKNLIKMREKLIIDKADFVIATSMPTLDNLRDFVKLKKTAVIENGVELSVFGQYNSNPKKDNRVIVYCGAIDNRFSWDIVVAVATKINNVQIKIYGEVKGELQQRILPSNVKLMGPIPYRLLPSQLKAANIAILPLVDCLLNEGRSPMKIYEYLACGLPVVASLTKELKRRNMPGVILANNSEEFVSAINNILNGKWLFPHKEVQEILQLSSWEYKAKQYMDVILSVSE